MENSHYSGLLFNLYGERTAVYVVIFLIIKVILAVFGLTKPIIKPKFTASLADATQEELFK